VLERIVESGLVPESVLRAAIRALCALRLYEERDSDERALVARLRAEHVAIATAAANAQHYDVAPAFFARVLGPHMKYSACYWPDDARALGDAEAAMLELTCERAAIADGQRVLDLGSGWGALALWIAARYPRCRVVAVSSSERQRAFVAARAAARGLANVAVHVADVATLALPAASFDRVVSIEMFEHVRNYRRVLAAIARWLAPDGVLFVHVFAHKDRAYAFDDRGAADWMAREFFTGGVMPSARLLHHFQDDLAIVDEWMLPGTHYARTAEAWLANLRAHRDELASVLGSKRRYERWRVFFLACAELFGYRDGREWIVAHYRFAQRVS
jgi:cyclopropane-fatty-acyl-phospholipid synthase